MRRLVAATAALLLAGSFGASHAAVIYSADFSGSAGVTHTSSSPAPAAPHSVAGPNWTFSYSSSPSTDTSANFARAAGDRFETEDWGGAATVTSDVIDVSLIDSVDVSWVGQTVGSAVFNNAGAPEQFVWFYTLDGGSPLSQSTNSDGSLDRVFAGVDVSGASSMQVGFMWNVDGGGDGFDIFSMTVEGEIAVPEPTATVLAGLLAVAGCVRPRR